MHGFLGVLKCSTNFILRLPPGGGGATQTTNMAMCRTCGGRGEPPFPPHTAFHHTLYALQYACCNDHDTIYLTYAVETIFSKRIAGVARADEAAWRVDALLLAPSIVDCTFINVCGIEVCSGSS